MQRSVWKEVLRSRYAASCITTSGGMNGERSQTGE
jgi:hypothetical protein